MLRASKAKGRGERSQEGSAETRGPCLVSRLEHKGLHWEPLAPLGRPWRTALSLPWEQPSLAQGGPIHHCHVAPAGTHSSPPLEASWLYLGCLSPLRQPGMCSVILSSLPTPAQYRIGLRTKI